MEKNTKHNYSAGLEFQKRKQKSNFLDFNTGSDKPKLKSHFI